MKRERNRYFNTGFALNGCIWLGLALRTFHFLRNPSVWHDEAALVLNVLQKGYAELLGPLRFSEAAPPLFLWSERAVRDGLGESTFALRLLPFLASCAALVLFSGAAKRILRTDLAAWAVLLFACSDHLLWHACEAKPYALDVLAATLSVTLFLFFHKRFSEEANLKASLARRANFGTFLLSIIFAVFAISTSYPACFVMGGLLTALLPIVWRRRDPTTCIGYAGLALTVFLCFGLLLIGPIRTQRNAEMISCWQNGFPPLESVGRTALWTLLAPKELTRYCCGQGCEILVVPMIVGLVRFWRGERRELAVLLMLPVLLALGSAFAGAYPFSCSRVVIFAAPAVILLSAEGAGHIWENWKLNGIGRHLLTIGLTAVLLVPLGTAVFRIAVPWPRADCDKAARLIRSERNAEEVVYGNSWEYEYYFRKLGPSFVLLEGQPIAMAGRSWIVTTAGTRAEQSAVMRSVLPASWESHPEAEYCRTTVFLCRPTE
jgi:hypothetical protein